ncbi:MAG: hypothetical protein WCQ47_06610 [bacterium]
MKKLLITVVVLMIFPLFISNVEALPQTACGQVAIVQFRPATQSLANATNTVQLVGYTGTGLSTTSVDVAKVATVIKMNGGTACMVWDLALPFDNNITMFQPM